MPQTVKNSGKSCQYCQLKKSLMDLDKGIEDKVVLDDLEKEITLTQDNQDRILIWEAHASRLIQKA